MAKIKEILPGRYAHHQFLYFCKGCGYMHAFALKKEGGHHDFNDDLENPTVTPSLVQNFTPGKMCHSIITDGKIQYLGDCWHELKEQTIELPEITEDMK